MITDFAERIGLDSEVRNRLKEIRPDLVDRLTENCRKSFNCLEKENDLTKLAVCLNFAEKYTLPFYREKGIDEDIFLETMKDITIWVANNGGKGLSNYKWIANHLKGELFRLGRLQFQFYTCKKVIFPYHKLPFGFGSDVIYVHIPQGEKLDFEKCRNSFESASEFFCRYFPDYSCDYYFCESWLLGGTNCEFMDSSSNIMKFQSLFDIVFSVPDDRQTIERVFGRKQKDIGLYPEDTVLRKSLKSYLLQGKRPQFGVGIREIKTN